ncbi:MAG: hypothetical protein ACPG45_10305 [Flavobacteriaceae bacterium]
MKNKFKNYLKLGILLFGISLTLVNCQKDDFETTEVLNLKENGHNDIIKKGPLTNFKELSRYVASKKALVSLRTTTEDVNGFSFIEDEDVTLNIIDDVNTYTLVIKRDGFQEYNFSNLIVRFQENKPTIAYIIDYYPTQEYLDDYVNNQLTVFKGKFNITDIDYDGFMDNQYAQRGDCITITTQMCSWVAPNGIGGNHVAGPDCTEAYLYVESQTICSYNESLDPGDSSPGGGDTSCPSCPNYDPTPDNNSTTGSGTASTDEDTTTGTSPDDTSIDTAGFEDADGNEISTTPTKPKTDPDPCSYIDTLLANDDIKALIEELNTNANLSLNYEKGYKFTTPNNGDLDWTEISGNTNENSIEVSVNEEGTDTGFVHTHYDGLVPNFSIGDIKTFNALYQWRKFKGKPLRDLTIMLISRGGVYALVIDDEEKFATEGYKLHEPEFESQGGIKDQYETNFIKDTNTGVIETNPQKVERLMISNNNTLNKYGLFLMKAKDDLSGWQKVEPHPTNINETTYENCN